MISSWTRALTALLSVMMLGACATHSGTGALVGAGAGAALGAGIDHKNRGRGALIGGLIGAAAGTVTGDQIEKAEQRGARRARGHANAPVHRPPHHPGGEVYRKVEPIQVDSPRVRTRVERLSDGRDLVIRERYDPALGDWAVVSERIADS